MRIQQAGLQLLQWSPLQARAQLLAKSSKAARVSALLAAVNTIVSEL